MRRLILALLLAGLVGAVSAPAATALEVHVQCSSPTPKSCSGWHTRDVFVDWTVDPPSAAKPGSCNDGWITFDTTGIERTCEAVEGADEIFRRLTIRVDKTPPDLTGIVPARKPDANGWYRSPVQVRLTGSDVTSGLASCTTGTYGGPDSASARVAGVCRDRAGNQSQGTFSLRYDSTAPTVTGMAPARAPDHGSWFTRPIGFSFSGTDALSGLVGCDPVVYGGPDSPAAPVTGTCRDQAGNVGTRAFSVPFDATPPALRNVKVRPADRAVRLGWAAIDSVHVEVSRAPGRGDARRTTLHRGAGTRLLDRRVRNGRRYEYRFRAVDQAGNVATRSIVVVPGPRLLAPARGARVSTPPVLRWTRVRGARYYNVQLFHDGRKVLSAWPSRARLALRRAWRYGGKQRLEPGRYRWVVWPGRGSRARNQYGPAIGRRSFHFAPSA